MAKNNRLCCADSCSTKTEPEWARHLEGKADLFKSVNDVLGTTNDSDWNDWIDHAYDVVVRTCVCV
jgi:hypothetical protein